MGFEDKELICLECGKSFMFLAGEQEFYQGKSFKEPKRCKICRKKRKKQRVSDSI